MALHLIRNAAGLGAAGATQIRGGAGSKKIPRLIPSGRGAAATCTSYNQTTIDAPRHPYRIASREEQADKLHVDLQVEAEEEASSANMAFLEAELHLLANAASDRAQMHSILAQQRDNWNKLFQGTLTLASFTACLLAALSARTHSIATPGLSVPALLLNAGCAAVMSVVNYFQPSQLAEEQRNAARQFKRLAIDVEHSLQVAPHLRQDTPALLQDSQRRLQALDAAFPMPLAPGGLEKFPSKVTPPSLLNIEPHNDARLTQPPTQYGPHQYSNGWDGPTSYALQNVAAQVRTSDISMYLTWSENVSKVNKSLAIAAPLLAASAAVLNAVGLLPELGAAVEWARTLAALCSLLSAFLGSVSHDLQLGTVFEMYRNAAGHYAEVEESIHNTLHQPQAHRENGLLFLHRVAYKLGRWTGDL